MARDFERSSSHHLITASSPLSAVPLSISAWVLLETTISAATIAGVYATAANDGWWIEMGGVSVFRAATMVGGTQSQAVGTVAPTVGPWYHVLGTFGPTAGVDRAIYTNGADKQTQTTDRTPVAGGINCVGIGRKSNLAAGNYWDGLIAEVTIWNVQLGDEEAVALANRAHSLTVRPGSIVGYWPLYGIGSPEPNLATSGLAMTVSGAVLDPRHAPVAPFPPADIPWMPTSAAAPPAPSTVPLTQPTLGVGA